jgi:hypothetical protein
MEVRYFPAYANTTLVESGLSLKSFGYRRPSAAMPAAAACGR